MPWLHNWEGFLMSRDMTKPTKWLCIQRRLRSGHPPSLIRVFAVRMKKAWALSYTLSTHPWLWSDWADAQADLSLCWAHISFCWFCRAAAHMSNKGKHHLPSRTRPLISVTSQITFTRFLSVWYHMPLNGSVINALNIENIWATAWQNQRNDLCAQQRLRSAWESTQSDQSLDCVLNEYLRDQGFFMQTVKTLIRLDGCTGWLESSLGTQVNLFLSCGGSFYFRVLT